MQKLILYSTSACSLCDTLLDCLLGLPEASGFSLEIVDIALDDNLLEQFGTRIPVLQKGSDTSALFELAQVPGGAHAPHLAVHLQAWLRSQC